MHILHQYETDFYSKDAAIAVLGFIRPEIKFGSLGWYLDHSLYLWFHLLQKLSQLSKPIVVSTNRCLSIFLPDALVERIGEDIKSAKLSLEEEVLKSYQTDRFFRM